MEHEEHAHVPYVILYLKALEKWQAQQADSTSLPTTYAKRKEFLALLMEMQMLNDQGIYNEENFAEAKQQLVRSFSSWDVSAICGNDLPVCFSINFCLNFS